MFKPIKFITLVCLVVFMPLLSVFAATSHIQSTQSKPKEVVSPVSIQPVISVDQTSIGKIGEILDGLDKSLTGVQDKLKNQKLPDADLVVFQKQIDLLPAQLDDVITKTTSYVSDIKIRIDQVGPAGSLPEDPAVTSERKELQKYNAAAEGVLKRANLFKTETTQMQATIDARRKELFAQSSWVKGVVWDIPDNLYSAFFGFKVGGIEISPFKISIAALLFMVIFAIFRLVLRWADRNIFSRLELGSRNATHTTFGYLGFVIAFCFAASYLGVDFAKLAIIAGALSVGIGFGLQAIVGNFISGLIILWERSVRIGDLIVVGPDRGVVSKISVRSTTIDTIDRSQVIIPNSMLISGVVTNFVRKDRIGRLRMTLTVTDLPDCLRIENLVKGHFLVLKDPPPTVEIVAISQTIGIEIELCAFVDDIMFIPQVKSELYFAILKDIEEDHIKEEQLFAEKVNPPKLLTEVPITGLKKKKKGTSTYVRDVDLGDK